MSECEPSCGTLALRRSDYNVDDCVVVMVYVSDHLLALLSRATRRRDSRSFD